MRGILRQAVAPCNRPDPFLEAPEPPFVSRRTVACWLLKSEPDEFSLADLERLGQARWDGVRNYQARNFLRAMAPDELFFFHHSSCAPNPALPASAASCRRSLRGSRPPWIPKVFPIMRPRPVSSDNPWTARRLPFVEAFPRC